MFATNILLHMKYKVEFVVFRFHGLATKNASRGCTVPRSLFSGHLTSLQICYARPELGMKKHKNMCLFQITPGDCQMPQRKINHWRYNRHEVPQPFALQKGIGCDQRVDSHKALTLLSGDTNCSVPKSFLCLRATGPFVPRSKIDPAGNTVVRVVSFRERHKCCSSLKLVVQNLRFQTLRRTPS